jgi:hypothetical protein
MMHRLLTFALLGGLALPVWAGAPPDKGKPAKLDVPTNITCTKAGDQLTIAWQPVENAALYRIHVEQGEADLMDVAPGPPYTLTITDLSDDLAGLVTAKVRAMAQMKGGRGASKTSESVPCQ